MYFVLNLWVRFRLGNDRYIVMMVRMDWKARAKEALERADKKKDQGDQEAANDGA